MLNGIAGAAAVVVLGLIYVLAIASPKRALLMMVGLYPFWAIGFNIAGDVRMLNVEQLILPAALVVLIAGLRESGTIRFGFIEWLLVFFAVWQFVVLTIQSQGDLFMVLTAGKHSLWLLYWIPVAALLTSERDLRTFGQVLAAQAVLISLISLLELVAAWDYSSWATRTDQLAVTVRFGISRIHGMFFHGVPTAMMVALTLPFAFSIGNRVFRWLAIGAGILTLYYCQSRAAWVGVLLGGGMALLAYASRGQSRIRAMATVVGVGVLLVVSGSLASMSDILLGTFDVNSEYGQSYERIESWLAAISSFPMIPFFGLGLNDFEVATTLPGVRFGEWPFALRGYTNGGPVYGIAAELMLIVVAAALLVAAFGKSTIPPAHRIAACAGAIAHLVVLHSNYLSYGIPLMLMVYGSVTVERRVAVGVHKRESEVVASRRLIGWRPQTVHQRAAR